MRLLCTVAAGACLGAIVLLSLVPGTERPRTGMSDLDENFLAYFGTAFLFTFGASQQARILIVLGLLASSITMETLQHFIPGRVPSLLDVFANGVGAAAGTASSAGLMRLILAIGRQSPILDHDVSRTEARSARVAKLVLETEPTREPPRFS